MGVMLELVRRLTVNQVTLSWWQVRILLLSQKKICLVEILFLSLFYVALDKLVKSLPFHGRDQGVGTLTRYPLVIQYMSSAITSGPAFFYG
jgi:hypothetical protein